MEQEYREINNELVVPFYRKFCKAFQLPFHFFDEMNIDSQNKEIANSLTRRYWDIEFHVHDKAMSLFNVLKPEFVFYKNQILQFKFSSWDEFSHHSWTIKEFLNLTADSLYYQKKLESRFQKAIATLALTALVLTPAIVGYCLNKLLVSQWIASTIGIITGMAASFFIARVADTIPKKMTDDKQFMKIAANKVNEIRSQLTNETECHNSATPEELKELVQNFRQHYVEGSSCPNEDFNQDNEDSYNELQKKVHGFVEILENEIERLQKERESISDLELKYVVKMEISGLRWARDRFNESFSNILRSSGK